MSAGLWIAKKNVLCGLIKKVSDANGGDDVEWLRDYVRDVVEDSKDCLDSAIACFSDVLVGSHLKFIESQKKAIPTNVCPGCGYVAPFCYYQVNKECSNITKIVPRRTDKGVYEAKKTGS